MTKEQHLELLEAFEIIAFAPNPEGQSSTSFTPTIIRRLHDQVNFSVGDIVTNGTIMGGRILSFHTLKGRVYVITTWSNVGMNLASLSKVPLLPSKFQPWDLVSINLRGISVPLAWITKVHFSGSTFQYDITTNVEGQSTHTKQVRLYNLPEEILSPRETFED